MDPVHRHSVHTLVFRSLKRTHDMFLSNSKVLPAGYPEFEKLKKSMKVKNDYASVMHAVDFENEAKKRIIKESVHKSEKVNKLIRNYQNMSVVPFSEDNATKIDINTSSIKKAHTIAKPKWHPPWKLYRVISGHYGWVRCCAVDPGNQYFATGAADRIIKIWDLSSGTLKLSLTGHISTVRGVAFSNRHPYLFSCGEDKQIKCWDLEYNKVVRHYHGHLSAIYSMALHPTIDVLLTAGRDCTARVWDMRTKANVHTLTGHTSTIASVICQVHYPQIITGSHDSTIRMWDIVSGKSVATLTNHKKSVRAVVFHPTLNMFASGSADNIKQWMANDGKWIQNLSGHNTVIDCLAVNEDGVLVSGGDNGTMCFWDWRTGYNFQSLQSPVQPGSIDSEASIFSLTFDKSGTRLISTDADKTIKLYKQDDTASEESHPINWKPEIVKRRKY